jgi:prepilin-type N-terminal cleavage/methylation domain-containing protein
MTVVRSLKKEGGFTLIEVMIASVLLLIGLLAISSGDIQALQMNRRSREDLRAVAAAESMMEMIRRNNKMVNDYNGFNTNLVAPPAISRMAQADFVNWQGQIGAIWNDQGVGDPALAPFTCGLVQVTRACGSITVMPVGQGISDTHMVNIVIVWPGRPNQPNDPVAPNATKGIQFISTVGTL